MIEVQLRDRVEMSQRERDVLKVMQVVLDGKRTHAEAARLLGVSRSRVDQFCRSGRLKFIQKSNSRFILRSDVLAFKEMDRPSHRPKKRKM